MADIVIIGPGRVGTAIAVAFRSAGHTVLGAFARHPDSEAATTFKTLTDARVWTWPMTEQAEATSDAKSALRKADVIVIATPDAAVTPAAQTLADTKLLQSHQIVVHCAGATPHTALAPLMKQAISAVCMHPLQTIASPERAPECFVDVMFTLDGTEPGLSQVAQFVEQIGGIPERIDPALRPRYHAAAVLASNAVVALMAVVAEVGGLSGGSRPFLPLLGGALTNLDRYGIPDALTGPVERGDLQTVSRHLIALQDNPTARRIYTALQSAATDVARRKGSLSPEQWQMFHDIFEDKADPTNEPLGGMLT